MKIRYFVLIVATTLVLQLLIFEAISYFRYEYLDKDRISSLKSDYLINNKLDNLMSEIGNATRVRVEVIQTAIHTPGRALPLYRFTTKFIKVKPNKDPGPYATDLPLSEWNDFLPDLIDKQCVTQQASQLSPSSGKERFDALNIGSFIACPMIDSKGFLIGAVFVSWDKGLEPDNRAITKIRDATSHITDYLERRLVDTLLDQIVLESYR